ncbi:HD domain-containing protein [Roseibium sediminicola]|uniref:HD domain-containing protein n=1 Tax=Roseibium sediminicola TaxID=2933272 RepID=A0ABT0GUQ4_9HYPH|nr:HD domain-containing protein [Roseibium sp. CAU 1639]
MLSVESGELLLELWHEYETCETPEAKFARALDKLEVQHQYNPADLKTWTEQELGLVYSKMDRECAHDSSLSALLAVFRARAEMKMVQAGVDPAAVKARAG